MSPDFRQALRTYAESLPAGSTVQVPREALLRLLDEGPRSVQEADWTAKRLAERWCRKPGTIRLWCEQGRVPGAYKFRNREWRLPHDRLVEFEARQRQHTESPEPLGSDAGDTGDWRNHLPKAG